MGLKRMARKRMKRMQRNWDRETRHKKFVYRVKAESRLPRKLGGGKLEFEQLESRKNAELIRNTLRANPYIKFAKVKRERPDKWQKKERRLFGKLTTFLETLTAG